MSQNQLITTRSGVYQFPSFQLFPSTGYKQFIYVDQTDGSCYEWDAAEAKYRSLRGGVRQWANSRNYYVGDLVSADQALFICVTSHTSVSTGTIFDETNKWRNASGYGRVDVTSVTGSATVNISEFNSGDFNIFAQPDNITSSLVITLPNPAQRTGQTLTYCFSAVPAVSSPAVVTFNNHTGTPYTYIPTFTIPNASSTHQGIRTVRFVSTAKGNGDNTAMWFPLDEDFRGATDMLSGSRGYVPAPAIADKPKFLSALGTWEHVLPRRLLSSTINTATVLNGSQANKVIPVDTTFGVVAIELPTSGMVAGDTIQLIDLAGMWGVNNVNVSGKLYGADDTYVLDLPKRKVTFVYIDSVTGYILE